MPTLPSTFPLKPPLFLPKPTSVSRIANRPSNQPLAFLSKIQSKAKPTHNFLTFSGEKLEFSNNGRFIFSVNSGNGGGEVRSNDDDEVDEVERLARAESTMPERFRYLTKEASDSPVRWPWFVALAFLVYAWRAVLFELANWRKAALAIIGFLGYLLKLVVALIFQFIGDPITSVIRFIETAIYMVRAFYSGIVAYAPVKELTEIILLASAILAVAEAAVPNSISSQQYILTVSGIIGYAAVSGYISEPLFWTLLFGLYGFSRLIKKQDDVTSALPVAAIMAAIGEPWVRVLVMASYLALAIFHHSKNVSEGKEETEVPATERRLPLPLLGAALAIGIRLAAKWAGYRHLTWMIV
ncbi:hypothetical protein SLEP1_g9783 [Rubroshorea leprosula]|uniref:Embryo defective n=1 Tax=Rubroshorea leprosula TaxID=152421 RepID=A0AAV5IDY2_9ROSI|nr:hypothetical protein SLEP1_g9783 [Rubroshorea leprosula]